jgi:hypothetical protein
MQGPAHAAANDWTYTDAVRRLVDAAEAQLPRHTASGRVDDGANRVIECSCGWTGNGLGWVEHLDHVVRTAVDGGSAAID